MDDINQLLPESAAISGRLVLSSYTKDYIRKLKKL
jgi:hypothetical protein